MRLGLLGLGLLGLGLELLGLAACLDGGRGQSFHHVDPCAAACAEELPKHFFESKGAKLGRTHRGLTSQARLRRRRAPLHAHSRTSPYDLSG